MAEYPAKREGVFHASFDETWDSVLEVIKISNGNIIMKDKSSGLIIYKVISDDKWRPAKVCYKYNIYMNVYIKSPLNTNEIIVYLVPYGITHFYSGIIPSDLYSVITSCYIEKEIEKDFFEKIEKKL